MSKATLEKFLKKYQTPRVLESGMNFEKPERHGQVWSAEEKETMMKNHIKNGASIKELAKFHQRTEFAIKCQLVLLGLLDAEGKDKMAKFKKGDHVRCKKSNAYMGKGDTGIVTNVIIYPEAPRIKFDKYSGQEKRASSDVQYHVHEEFLEPFVDVKRKILLARSAV
jgi:hypothetical protein